MNPGRRPFDLQLFSEDEGGSGLLIGGQEYDLDDDIDPNDTLLNFNSQTDDGGAGGEGGGKKPDDKGQQPDPTVEALRTQIATQAAELEALKSRAFNRTADSDVERKTVQQPPVVDVEAIKKNLEESFLKDPGGTLINLFQTAEQSALAKMRGEFASSSARTGSLVIDSFKQTAKVSDPNFTPEVEKEFDTLVSQIRPEDMVNVNAMTLDSIRKIAIGEAVIKGNGMTRRENIPPRGMAQGGGGGIQVNAGGGASRGGGLRERAANRRKLTKDDLEIIRYGKEYGMSDDEIRQALEQESD